MVTQIARNEQIQKIVDYIKAVSSPEAMKQIGDHFAFFDPENPDYSDLAGLRKRGPQN